MRKQRSAFLAVSAIVAVALALPSAASATPRGITERSSVAVVGDASAAPLSAVRMGEPVQNVRPAHTDGPDSIPVETTPNWSGYVDTNHTAELDFRNIAATWNVPEIPDSACPSGNYGYRLAAVWVGLDGDGSKTVEQIGTTSQCHNGTLSYYSWWEMYPKAPVVIGSVDPGDQISAYADYTGQYWLLSLVDNTSAKPFSTLQACPGGASCDNFSAEAIVEAPGGCVAGSSQVCNGSLYPLADFDFVGLHGISDATLNAGGSLASSSFGPAELEMKAGSTTLAEVSTSWKNDSFQDSWKAST